MFKLGLVYRSGLAIVAVSLLAACIVKPKVDMTVKQPVNKQPIENVIAQKQIFSCDYSQFENIGRLVKSYIRIAQSNADIEFTKNEYIQARDKEYLIVQNYVSQEYLKEFYILTGTARVADTPVKSRLPELICIKQIDENQFEALIFEYNPKSNAHVSVNKMIIKKEICRYVLLPFGEPTASDKSEEQWARHLGATNWPTTSIYLTEKLYAENE